MTITKDTQLPTYEELTVPEINVTASGLHTAAFQLGMYCEEQSKEFMQCRTELKDPRKCLEEGKAVTSCGLDFFMKVKKSCLQEFLEFQTCVLESSRNYSFVPCRKSQTLFDECVKTKIGVEKPPSPFYFCEPKVHESKRPKPVRPMLPKYPDAPPSLPEGYEEKADPIYWNESMFS